MGKELVPVALTNIATFRCTNKLGKEPKPNQAQKILLQVGGAGRGGAAEGSTLQLPCCSWSGTVLWLLPLRCGRQVGWETKEMEYFHVPRMRMGGEGEGRREVGLSKTQTARTVRCGNVLLSIWRSSAHFLWIESQAQAVQFHIFGAR